MCLKAQPLSQARPKAAALLFCFAAYAKSGQLRGCRTGILIHVDVSLQQDRIHDMDLGTVTQLPFPGDGLFLEQAAENQIARFLAVSFIAVLIKLYIL